MGLTEFLENLGRAFAYAKQGWKSKDWDYAYLYDDIIFKLKRMEYAMENGMHSNRERTASEIKTARLALERLNKDDYMPEEYVGITDKGRKILYDVEEARKKGDLELFASQFVKHSRTWWDIILIMIFIGGYRGIQ